MCSKFQQSIKIKQITKTYKPFYIIMHLNQIVIHKLQLDQHHKQSIDLTHQMLKSTDLISKHQLQTINFIQLTLQSIYSVINIYQTQIQPINQSQTINQNNKKKTQFFAIQFINTYKRLLQQVKRNNKYFIQLWQSQEKLLTDNTQNWVTYQQINQSLQKQQKQFQSDIQHIKKIVKQSHKQCEICMTQMSASDIGYLNSCKHLLHRSCITDYIKNALNNGNIDIKCPMENCPMKFSPNDIQMYIEENQSTKFHKLSINKYVQTNNSTTIHCFTPNCEGVFQHNNQVIQFKCSACKKQYCIKCQNQIHKEISCQLNKANKNPENIANEKKTQNFIKEAKFQRCPHCGHMVQKKEGCVSIKCRCGKQFCYKCGGADCPHGRCKKK